MGAPVVVALEPFPKSPVQGWQAGVFKKVDPFVFHAHPESLDEDVLHPAAFAIHADFHTQIQQLSRPFR